MSKMTLKPLAAAVGAAFMASVAIAPLASASENPFKANELNAGYQLADSSAEGKCGEGKCGGAKKASNEGKCGAEKKAAKGSNGEEHKAAQGGNGDEHKADQGKTTEEKSKAGEGKCGSKG